MAHRKDNKIHRPEFVLLPPLPAYSWPAGKLFRIVTLRFMEKVPLQLLPSLSRMINRTLMLIVALTAGFCVSYLNAQTTSWAFLPSDYTHDPATGARVGQYAPVPPVEPLPDPRLVTSGLRRTRTSLIGPNGSIDTSFQVQNFGNGRGGLDAEFERFADEWRASFLSGSAINQTTAFGPPGLVPPGFGAPGFVTPGFSTPGIGTAGLGTPGFGVPGFVAPTLVQPNFVPPGAGQPGFGQPGFRQPGFRQPGFLPPGARFPRAGFPAAAGGTAPPVTAMPATATPATATP